MTRTSNITLDVLSRVKAVSFRTAAKSIDDIRSKLGKQETRVGAEKRIFLFCLQS